MHQIEMGYPVEFHGHLAAAGNPSSVQACPTACDDAPTLRKRVIMKYPCLQKMTLAVMMFIAIFFFALYPLVPQKPPNFLLSSLTLSAYNDSSSPITANWDISFQVENPNNDFSFAYQSLQASTLFQNASLSSTSMSDFRQNGFETTPLHALMAASPMPADDSLVGAIAAARRRGYLDLTITVDARVVIDRMLHKTKRRKIRVLCEEIYVSFSAEVKVGKLLNGTKECKVEQQEEDR